MCWNTTKIKTKLTSPMLKYFIKQSNGTLMQIPPINEVNLIDFVSFARMIFLLRGMFMYYKI